MKANGDRIVREALSEFRRQQAADAGGK